MTRGCADRPRSQTALSTPRAVPSATALAIPDYVKLLEAGINVVTTSTTARAGQSAPVRTGGVARSTRRCGHAGPGRRSTRRELSRASPRITCRWFCSTLSSSIEKIHAFEIGLYDDYGVPDIMINEARLWPTLDYQPWISFPRRDLRRMAGTDPADRRCARGQTPRGTRGLRSRRDGSDSERRDGHRRGGDVRRIIRMQAIGVVDGREAIVIEHIHPIGSRHVAPDWPIGIGDLVLPRRRHRRSRHRLHAGGNAEGSAPGRRRRYDVRGGRDGCHRDARAQRGALCRCGATRPAEFGRSTADHPAQRLCHAIT